VSLCVCVSPVASHQQSDRREIQVDKHQVKRLVRMDQKGRNPATTPTKKNPAPTGEEEGRMKPSARESWMKLSIASLSGRDGLKTRLEGEGAPWSRLMAQ